MGVYCGLAMLVNPSLMLALFAILGWTVYQTRPIPRHGLRGELWICGLHCSPSLLPGLSAMHGFSTPSSHCAATLDTSYGREITRGHGRLRRNARAATKTSGSTPTTRPRVRSHIWTTNQRWPRPTSAHMPGTFIRLSAERVARFWTGAGSEANSGGSKHTQSSHRCWASWGWRHCSNSAAPRSREGHAFFAANRYFSIAVLHHAS